VGFWFRTFAVGNKDLLVTRKNYCTHFGDSFLLFLAVLNAAERIEAARAASPA
jgi:hypothetical protein